MSPFALPQVLGQRLETYRAFNFSGGLDIQTAPTALAALRENKWLTVASNVAFNDDGSVSKRWGMIAKGDSVVQTSAIILGGIRWATSTTLTSQTDVVPLSTGKVYSVASGGWTEIKTGLTGTRSYSFAIYNDLLHVANGVDAPQRWDGTTWAALGGSSPATTSYFEVHGNRMFALAAAVPSRVYWSKLNATTDWAGTTDAGFLDVNPNDGGILTTLVSGTQELMMGKTNRPYRLQGIGPTTGYTVADNMLPADGAIGPTSSEAAAYVGNDVWYGSQSGIHRMQRTQDFGDLKNTFVSRRIEPYFRFNSSYFPYDALTYQSYTRQADAPKLAYDAANGLVMYLLRQASGSNATDFMLVYNLSLDAWARWDYGDATGGFNTQISTRPWPSLSSAQLPEMHFGMYSLTQAAHASALVAFRNDQTSDVAIGTGTVESIAIAAQIRHVSNLGASGTQKAPRYLYLYFKKESAATTITLNLYADFRTTAVLSTTFDITSSTAETLVIKRIDLGGFLCEYLEVDLQQATAGKMFTFYGYEVQWRPRRQIRRAE